MKEPITESYFGYNVEIIKFMEDIKCYLVKINGKYALYDDIGEDALGLSSIDPDDLK